ncbi:MAG TPA: CBS domain-containing protein [Anaerolineae bacterium]|nr:CBS domain-containing protein [Anaerolineae bacterium]
MQIILTHENADFDAIASLLGAHKLYPNARPVLPLRINRNVQAYLDLYGVELPFVHREIIPRGRRVKRVILVDTQGLTTIRGMGKHISDVLIIDHHMPPESLPEGWRFQGELIGATTTLLVEALSARLIPMSAIEATLLLTGIYEDTGSLTYGATSSRDLRAAAWLMEQGASLEIVGEFLEHPLTLAQQSIYNELRAHVETLMVNGHPIILSWAQSPPNVEEEISTLAHKLRDLFDPSALFILVQLGENTQLVSRSTTDDISVSEVAQYFGGGGHNRAAAALIHRRVALEVYEELRALLPGFVRPRVTVRDLMSRGVRTVEPHTSVALAAQQMLRTGHEGFPVVDAAGQVMGLVTRNAVDRAMQHHWERQPVHRIMQPGDFAVAPEDSAERVRTLMIHSGWGQIPVVEEGRVVGVVTRTDMIRMPPSAQESERRRMAQLMATAFPQPLLDLIRVIGAQAAELCFTIYFVGGIVRDLLLGQPIGDIDLVVEGDAIALGQALAETYGGEIHTHSRFGTVKWTLPEGVWSEGETRGGGDKGSGRQFPPHPLTPSPPHPLTPSALPASIDLVTARTEFYEHPTALPTVERSSIKQDLHRRDFTINTLAIRLDPQRWGDLLDFYGGKVDIEAGVIRVLHSLSFVDDPTRILRAARFEARLDFRLDPRSESLIADALPMLNRITGGRVRHELDLILKEARPEAALERLQALGALRQIHPSLLCDDWLRERFARLRQAELLDLWGVADEAGRLFLHWALFLYRLPLADIVQIVERLLIRRTVSVGAKVLPELPRALDELMQHTRPSQITAQLEALPLDVQAVAWLATDDAIVRARLEQYAREWRHVAPQLTGKALCDLGFKPGPLFRDLFIALRRARLDGDITTLEEEIALVKNWEVRET